MVALERWTDVWAPVMLTITWQVALLALLVLACERALRIRAPQVRHRLWWLVLAAPLMLAPIRLALDRHDATLPLPAPAPAVRAVGFTHSLFQPTELLPANEGLSGLLPPAPPPPPARDFKLSLGAVLLAAWVLGCTIVGGRLLLGHRSLRRLLAASRPVTEGGVIDRLEALRREAGVTREVALHSTADLNAPLLYGLRKPTILMPHEWLESLSEDDLRVVLAHEVAHVKRRDVLGNLLQRLAELPLFFHPAAWLAGRRIMLAREELCDAAALGDTPDARSYALSLLSVAERTRGRLALASLGVAEGRFTLLRRVEAIMADDRGRRFSRAAAALLGLLILAVAVAFAAVELRSGGESPLQGHVLTEPQQVNHNMKHIALALQMYLADHDDVLPHTNDAAEVIQILHDYVKTQDVFMRPGTDQIAVRFTFAPGLNIRTVRSLHTTACAVVDYHPDFRVTAYLDGHVVSEPPVAPAPAPVELEEGPTYPWLAEPARTEALQVLTNMKNIAIALQMFLADHDDMLPDTTNTSDMMELLHPYVKDQSIFLRPGTKTPAMKFTFEPGVHLYPLEKATTSVCALVDYHPEWKVEVYLDGHAQLLRQGDREAALSEIGGISRNSQLAGPMRHEPQYVLSNMKNIAVALQMWLADHDDVLPNTNDIGEVMEILRGYVRSQDVFMKPGTAEPVVRFTFLPKLVATSVQDPVQHIIAVVDYAPDWRVEAYLDGHCRLLPKGWPVLPGIEQNWGYPWLAEPARSEALLVLENMRNIAMVMQMFLVDHNVLPNTNDTGEVMEILGEHVRSQDIFMKPGTSEPVVKFTFEPGARVDPMAVHSGSAFAVVDYHPEWRVTAYLDAHVTLEPKAQGQVQTPPSPRRGPVLATSEAVTLLNLWRYGPRPLVAGMSWTYEYLGERPIELRIVEAEPNQDGTATSLTLQLTSGREVLRARARLPRDRNSVSVSTGAEWSALTFPPLKPGAKWNPLEDEEGTVTSVDQLPLTTPAGHCEEAAKITVSFGEARGDMTFWFGEIHDRAGKAVGGGLLAVEATRRGRTTKVVELTGYQHVAAGPWGISPSDLPSGTSSEDLSDLAGSMLLTLSPYGPAELRPGATWTYRTPESAAPCRLKIVGVTPGSSVGDQVVTADCTLFGTTKRVEIKLFTGRRLLWVQPAPTGYDGTMALQMPELKRGDRWAFLGKEEVPVRAVELRRLSVPAGDFPDAVRIALGGIKDDAALWFAPGVGLVALDDNGRTFFELTEYRPGPKQSSIPLSGRDRERLRELGHLQ